MMMLWLLLVVGCGIVDEHNANQKWSKNEQKMAVCIRTGCKKYLGENSVSSKLPLSTSSTSSS